MKYFLNRNVSLLKRKVSLFEGEGGGEQKPPATFTQEQVNQFLAEDRKKHQKKIEETTKKFEEIQNSAKLTAEEKDTLAKELETLKTQYMTTEEKLQREKKQAEESAKKQTEQLTLETKKYKTKYEQSTIERALLDAAVGGKAYNPTQIVELLKTKAKLVENDSSDEVKVLFTTVNDKKEKVTLELTPQEVIARMQEDEQNYGNLFKSDKQGGFGGTPSNRKDVKNPAALSPEEYKEYRKKRGW